MTAVIVDRLLRAKLSRLIYYLFEKKILTYFSCYLFFIFPSDQSTREMDTEIDAFLGSKSPKKPVDPLSYIKVSCKE